MRKRFLVVGDIHFGYYPPELLYKEFQLILDIIVDYNDIDCVVIAGDYYDTKLSMASAHSVYSVKAFSDLIKICEGRNIKVRQIKGTNSHDPENQLKNLAQIANSSRCDYKLFMTVDEEEIFPGMNVLYIPEEYMEDSKEYYKEYFNKKYQLVFGHGMFEETNFSTNNKSMKKYPIFNSKEMEDICEGPIVFGHIHTAQRIRNRIQYTGSLVRSRFGEEEAKGFYIVDFDNETKETEFEFIENDMTMKYDTIEIKPDNQVFSLMINEQINYFKNLVKTYNRDYLRIKIYTPEDMMNSSTFVDNMNVVFNDMKNVKLQIIENSKVKLDKELREKVNLLMDKYNFIFDKSVGYDEKIREYIKLKTGKEISLERIRSMISGNSVN